MVNNNVIYIMRYKMWIGGKMGVSVWIKKMDKWFVVEWKCAFKWVCFFFVWKDEKCIHLEATMCIQSAAATRRDDIAWNVIVRTTHLASSPADHYWSMEELMMGMMGMKLLMMLLLLLLMLWMVMEDRTGWHGSMGQRSLGTFFLVFVLFNFFFVSNV